MPSRMSQSQRRANFKSCGNVMESSLLRLRSRLRARSRAEYGKVAPASSRALGDPLRTTSGMSIKAAEHPADHPVRPAHLVGGRGIGGYRIGWVLLSMAAVLPFATAKFPPLYDFHEWLFQGHLVAVFLTGRQAALDGVGS